jgi:hypothetical protein
VEPVSIDTPREAPTPVARLDMRPIDVEALLGLEFVAVANDLAPATLALGRMTGGTLVGFAHLDHGPERGVDVVQFGERRPRDVLTELLYDTGITHDTVTWTALGPREDDRMWARSMSEAWLYILLRTPSDQGSDDEVLEAVVTSQVGPDRVMRYGDIELWVPPERIPPGMAPLGSANYSHPDDPPSTIFDAANWFMISQTAGLQVKMLLEEHQPPYAAWAYHNVLRYLQRAAAAAEEALKFIPPGADEVPVTACWTADGLDTYRCHADKLRRDNLERNAESCRVAAGEWRRTVGPTIQD